MHPSKKVTQRKTEHFTDKNVCKMLSNMLSARIDLNPL